MRLIDADELMRSHCVECTYYNSGECLGVNCDWDSIGHIREAKTVDAVPVIRCKDCKHWQCDDVDSYCDELGIFGTDMNSYCSYAKRK